jgi:N-acetylglucosaminyl-diphospho-decaprenol L-rhamnosyltransferase
VTLNLSIVIVSYNTREILLNCLASIAHCTGQSEVVVVDNGSSDGSVDAVRGKFPNVRTIQNPANQGYARASMLGFRATTGRYVLFLNSDTIVPVEALRRLVSFMEERPGVAACGPKLTKMEGTAQAFAFGRDPTLSYLLARAFAKLGLRRPLHDWETTEIQPVDWISGACLLIRRTALDQVAGFDEHIFMYFEDNDLCLRLRRAGWQVVYNPQVTIIHTMGGSPTNHALRSKYYYESLLYFYSKHYSLLERSALRMMLPFYRFCFR